MSSETVRVELAERSYDILFGKINSPAVISAFTALPQKNVLICADSNTSHFLPEVKSVLQQSGKTVYEWVFPAGESSKNMDNAMKLCGYASSLKLGRNALFAALFCFDDICDRTADNQNDRSDYDPIGKCHVHIPPVDSLGDSLWKGRSGSTNVTFNFGVFFRFPPGRVPHQ